MQVANFQERPWSHRPPELEWWAELNAELAVIGESEAGLGDATYYRNRNYSPFTAARLIAEERGGWRS